MMPLNDGVISLERVHETDADGADARKVTLVGVSSGVVAGRRLRVKGNAQLEWWALFTTLDQLDTCLTAGELRFADPILFAQVRREFEHVFNRPSPHELDSSQGADDKLRGAGP